MPRDDLVYIRHMRDLALAITGKVSGKTRAEFDNDDNLRLAVAHLIQTIGEAASRVADPYRKAHPEIPWHHIVGMRHRIVHDYMDIDFDIVWDVAAADMPTLLTTLIDVAGDRVDRLPLGD
jgi:uncharacterized protein with HEPN domain